MTKTQKTEYKTIAFQLEDFDEEQGIFTGYGSVFSNVDDGEDVVEPGAFADTIAGGVGRIKILALHNDEWLPIGIPIELREDSKGLFVKAKISDTSMGKDVKILIRDKVLGELSIGYDPVDFYYDNAGVRHLTKVELWEISVVTWAMNPQAVITGYKSRDAAFSFAQIARGIAMDIKAGRTVPEAQVKSLEDACTAMKASVPILSKAIAEAKSAGSKTHKRTHKTIKKAAGRPEAQKTKTIEIFF